MCTCSVLLFFCWPSRKIATAKVGEILDENDRNRVQSYIIRAKFIQNRNFIYWFRFLGEDDDPLRADFCGALSWFVCAGANYLSCGFQVDLHLHLRLGALRVLCVCCFALFFFLDFPSQMVATHFSYRSNGVACCMTCLSGRGAGPIVVESGFPTLA